MSTIYLSLGSNIGDRAENIFSALSFLQSSGYVDIKKVSSFYETSSVGRKQRNFYNIALKAQTRLSPQDLLALIKQAETLLGRKPSPRWGKRLIDIDILFHGKRVIVPSPLAGEGGTKSRVRGCRFIKFINNDSTAKTTGLLRRSKTAPRNDADTVIASGNKVSAKQSRSVNSTFHIPHSTLPLTLPHKEICNRLFVLIPLNEIAPNFKHPVLNRKINDILKNNSLTLANQKVKITATKEVERAEKSGSWEVE